MYYYEQAYTKLKDRLPGDKAYGRMNDDARFLGEKQQRQGGIVSACWGK